MAVTLIERWTWDVERYETAGAAGVFGPEARVELIDGEVYSVPAMLPGHAATVRKLLARVATADPDRWTVGSQTPVRLDDRSEPEPDLWVACGPMATYDERHPTPADLVLVVEVSGTSLAFDRDVKLPRYAAAGIAEAWIVSLAERAVHRYQDPSAGRYRTIGTLAAGTLAVAGLEVDIALVWPSGLAP